MPFTVTHGIPKLAHMDSAHLLLFLQAALIGLSIAAPVGPIGLLCIQRTLQQGPRIGLATGLGAAVADAMYGALGAWGVSTVIGWITGARIWLGLGGGLFLLWLAWGSWRAAAPERAAAARAAQSVATAFAGTVALTLSNPMTILSFAAIFSALSGVVAQVSPLWMVAGVLTGSAAWWLFLVGLVSQVRHKVSATQMQWIQRGSALVLAGFGMVALTEAVGL